MSERDANLWAEFVKALKQEVVPALGCTEPISLALASALAARHLGKQPERIEAWVSANLMKNGMGVTVPGTGTVGLPIAAAVGALGGDADAKLEVLKSLTLEHVQSGKRMLEEGKVKLGVADVPNILYAEACVWHGEEYARVAIADAHTNVVAIEHNGEVLLKRDLSQRQPVEQYDIDGATARDVYDFAMHAPLEMMYFIHEAAVLNGALADEGMSGRYGLHIGATLQRQIEAGLLSEGLLSRILTRTTAASDARMGGATLPAMSNSGSGNQGIAATMPVVVVAEHVKADQERLTRALVLSHLIAIYIHTRLPRLSALCAVTTASMGAAAGMAELLNGGYPAVSMAISSMIGDLAGMICDGASNSCAMKVSTSAGSAYKSVLMALDGTRVTGNEGIVAHDVDVSIANLGKLAYDGMAQTDTQILRIMMHKS
ncbi:serine dehydratase subunit alpha family protein [Chromobacterium sp. IIBBL 290-4]|uniref:L-cysteine desulfidase family protein n=1 Tax=Chromobacterium sp. IIBBL 290-4 TaxID=2953890 RepID=UPI0020B7A3D2|nr:L-serine ammonia-lyase, iron-sulfur-dependent, subunit alpha [Chromobacterium sp. IIBBL 290-4]UTH74053.1 L-serine ammonia-lyase, iron-sulfur-dependent, subunit alpha [Chromobacterium sp. IIBBL 290-4]